MGSRKTEVLQQHPEEKVFTVNGEIPFEPGTVTLVTGYWDLTHFAHVGFLRACKELGNPLVVGVHTQTSKPGRPILSAEERLPVIAELQCVDHVFLDQTGYTPEMIKKLRPKTVVFSSGEKDSPEKAAEIALLVSAFPALEISTLPRQSYSISTTEIIDRILRPRVLVGEPIDMSNIKDELIRLAETSEAKRKMSAFLVDPSLGLIVAKGINYHPKISGAATFENTDTLEYRDQLPRPTHAEVDCILNYIKAGGRNFDQLVLYTLAMPCAGCAEHIVRSGIKNVGYVHTFDNNYGELILREAGVTVSAI